MRDQLKPIVAGMLLVGCQGGVEAENNPVPETERPLPVEEVRGVHPQDVPPACPVGDDDVQIRVEETPKGAALVFLGTGDAERLQARVRPLAAAYAELDERPLMWSTHLPVDRTAEPGDPGSGVRTPVSAIPHMDVAYEPTADGARLVFTARDPGARDRMTELLTEHRDQFLRGLCMVPVSVPPPTTLDDE